MIKIGIIGAMEEEITPILALFPQAQEIALGGNVFYHIAYKGAEIYVAYSKIGKVHSAITASTMILRFGCEKVIFCGVAGGLDTDLAVGDLLLGSKLCQHDVDISAFGHPLGFIPESRVFIETDENLNAIARQVALESNITLKEGIIASGDAFIHSKEKKQWIIENFGAAAVEMEGASVAVVCDSFKVPCCILRSISDSADGAADVSFDEFLDSSARIGANFVKQMIDRLV
ncbi:MULTISPECIES: 5'-methylthioadenosine/adenosylhomocysteine nucleosidase [Helicobacter]|uniref:adenosylhomocysteine nucleosidase n=2 Tax=Helicobacter TaxID=209 RepID=A0A377J1G7_9HELI|nr:MULTISPECIES: 5'-methylthioadenosine/adenosylhomocysteine nucleosidase [Helicobacter]MDL0080513.1 5'-methylthioadenosine/adenosylhomocysteine nucleosidase [Helicobacter sp. CPD2-1]MDL0082848.1 5'-methylthioadenosine/adenosylhomocysteine nucleosidase [Helicobacter sp. XJK30-2]STO96317.1 5'-methylthioadenosine/S-adenosylhomocysteine nucleosidase [Helicobacter canis]